MAKNRSQYSLEILLGAKKASSFQSGINGAKNELEGMSSTAKKVAGLIATAFGAIKIKDFVKESVDTFSDYEQSLANTAAIANATQTEQEQLNEAAREAGKATTKTAKESADALGYMALAGWNVKESTSALQPVLKLSAASNMDLATCSDLVTDSMSALKLQVKDLPEYLDMVTKAQNSSNMNSQQMMEAYIKAGGAARTLGVSAKDTGVALGILANNGTKGAEGGTVLNAMLTRLGSNKNALSMMGALGISIFDAQGKFVGLEEALKRINAGVSGLSTEDQAKALKEIAGTNYYSKMAYLLDGVKEGANGAKSAWDDLDKKLKNSDGSLEDMYNKQTNTLSATREIMNSALDDLKISFADSFDGELAEGIKKLTEFINETSENISDFADTHQVEIHNAFETFYDDVESIGNVVGDVGRFVVGNFDAISSGIEAIGTAVVTYKVASRVSSVATSLMNFASGGPVGLAIAGAATAATAIVGIGIYAKKTQQRMAQANLEQHFGSISLSLDTLDEIAQQIVGKKKLMQVSEMLESIGKTDDAISAMSKSFKSVSEISWKVKAGFKIDKDDVDKYKSSVEEYVKSAKEAVESKGYTVSIATRLLLGNNSKVGKENNEFYAGLDSKLNSLQKKLNKKLNDAVKNGIDVDTDSAVQKLLGQIDDITSAVTNAENEAQLQTINLKYSGKDLTAQDFKQLTKDVKDYEKKAMSGYQEAYTTSMTNLNARRNTGDLSQKQYASEKKKIESAYYKQQQNTLASGSKYIMNSIQDTYPQVKGVMKRLQMNLKRGFKEAAEQGLSANELEATMNEVVDNALSSADLGKDSDAIISLFKNGLGDIWTQMDDLQEQMKQKGVKTTNSFASGMTDIEALSAITGSSQDAMALLGKDINENDEWATIVNACKQNGANIPEEIANGIDENSTTVNDAATRLMDKLKNSFTNKGINTVISLDMVTEPVNNGSKVTYNTPIGPTQQKKSSSGGNSKKTTVKGKKNAKGGIYNNPIISLLAEKDSEAVIPLNNSPRSKALYQRTGELLGMSFTDDNTSYKQRRDVRLYNAVKRSPSMGGEKINITYSPTIQVNGNADEKTLTKVVKMSQAEFAKMMQKYMQSNKRVKFS